MKTNTTSPFEDDNNGRHDSGGEASHQLGGEKIDDLELTRSSAEGDRVDENQPSSAADYNDPKGSVDPVDTTGDREELASDKTADEVMREHLGEAPKAKTKFSLASLKSKSDEPVPKSKTKPGTIKADKPNDDVFVRTSNKPEEWSAFDFIELKSDNKKLYLLTPDIVEEINSLNESRAQVVIKIVKKRLIYSVTRGGEPFLWPITIMDDNDWIDSAYTCAEEAKETWVRVVSNQAAGRYDYVTSPSTIEPKWPSVTYEEAVLKAFDGKVIDSMGHDLIQQLLGEH